MVRRLSASGLFTVFAVFLALVAVSSSAVAAATTYTDPQGRVSFTIPDGWQQQNSLPPGTTLPPGVDFVTLFFVPTLTNGFKANVNIVTNTVPAGTTLDQIVSNGRAALPKVFPSYQAGPDGVQNVTVGSQPAEAYQFSAAASGTTFQGEQVVVLAGTRAYVITFAASATDLPTLLQQGTVLLSSFMFTGNAGTSAAGSSAPPTATAPPTVMSPAPPTATAPPTVAPPAPPRTGGGGEAAFVRRLGNG